MLIGISTVVFLAAAAQSTPDPPRFEAASVKGTDQCGVSTSMGPGTVVLSGIPLKPILAEAFELPGDRIVGPSWLDEDCFEIVAKMPEGAGKDRIPAMLQALLAERFKLAAHREDRPRSVYVLVVDKDGPKFKVAGSPTGQTMFRAGLGIAGFKGSMTMATLARRLSGKGYGQVQDLTGLKGTYDIDLSWAPDPTFEQPGAYAREHAAESAEPPPGPTANLFTALRDSLGLKLESRKEPVESLVIDRIERVPTGN